MIPKPGIPQGSIVQRSGEEEIYQESSPNKDVIDSLFSSCCSLIILSTLLFLFNHPFLFTLRVMLLPSMLSNFLATTLADGATHVHCPPHKRNDWWYGSPVQSHLAYILTHDAGKRFVIDPHLSLCLHRLCRVLAANFGRERMGSSRGPSTSSRKAPRVCKALGLWVTISRDNPSG